jgi:beta-glucanase (GH16 family)
MNSTASFLLTILLIIMTTSSCQKKQSENNPNNENAYEPGAKWELYWADEFEGDQLDDKIWNRQVVEAGRFNEEWQRYTDSTKNAYVEDGLLVIKAIHEDSVHGMNNYTSARLNTANNFSFKYGKVAARIKLPYSEGIWPAFWMLGANIDENGGDTPWPESGEIDILELYGTKSDSAIEANIHFADSLGKHAQMGAIVYELEEEKFADDFHIFALEWDVNKVTWMVDETEFASFPITSPELSEFHQEFFLLLNIAVGGTWAGRPDDRSVFPQYMYVDWIRFYKLSES